MYKNVTYMRERAERASASEIYAFSGLKMHLHIVVWPAEGPSMMTRYARSYSLQKGPSLEDSVE